MQRPSLPSIEKFHEFFLAEGPSFRAKDDRHAFPMDAVTFQSLLATARQVGMLTGFLEKQYAADTLILNHPQYDYVRQHLYTAQRALQTYWEVPEVTESPDLSIFFHGTLAQSGAANGHKKLEHLLEGTHMLGFEPPHDGQPAGLFALLHPRNKVMAAMALIRPDLVGLMRERMDPKAHNDEALYGSLPMTSEEIGEFIKSYQEVTDTLQQHGARRAAERIDQMHRHYWIRRKPPGEAKEGARRFSDQVVRDEGKVKYSMRADEKSLNSFMLPMATLDPAFDVVERLERTRTNPTGLQEKFLSSKDEYHLRYANERDAEDAQRLLRQLLNDGESIRVETAMVQHKPQHWLIVPGKLHPAIIDEAQILTTFLRDAAEQFQAGDRDKALQTREQIMDHMRQRGFPVNQTRTGVLEMNPGNDSARNR